MSTSSEPESAQALASRMDAQRAQLQRQFVRKPEGAVAAAGQPSQGLQSFEPRSLLMKLLLGQPQLLQKIMLMAATTALGARASPWLFGLLRLLLQGRSRP